MIRTVALTIGIFSFSVLASFEEAPATWTGLTAGKLLAISKQGDQGFQYSMLYIMGLADGLESRYIMNWQRACRSEGGKTNQEIAARVLARMDKLNAPSKAAGNVAVNAYLSEYCQIEIINADSRLYDTP